MPLPIAPNPFLGVVLHAIGGFAAGSFYIPFKKVKGWAWESYWLVGGFFSWIIAPWIAAFFTCPDLLKVLASAPVGSLLWTYLFGVLWGVGGLTFGLSMRYLGMSLGYALALGFCAAFGTIIPPLYGGKFLVSWLFVTHHGLGAIAAEKEVVGLALALAGVLVCLAGIAVCGKAGVRKEGELSADQKKATIREFSFVKGVWVAIFAGVMSACMAFAFEAGKPIAEHAVASGSQDLFKNFPVLIVALAGGFTTNCIWCVILNVRNKTGGDYLRADAPSLLVNYVFSALAGVAWYFQFFFYGMGTTKMGKYDFSSWTIHMAFIIVFSNLWGLHFHEWRGVSRLTRRIVWGGLAVLILSTVVIGAGNYVARTSPLKVVHLAAPAEPQLRLGWEIDFGDPPVENEGQTAYQVLLATSPDILRAAAGDLWDSGRVESTQSRDIPYGGKPVPPRTPCWAKVRIWDRAGRPSAWTDPVPLEAAK
jgi:L-rhamnose-H+ transport protein